MRGNANNTIKALDTYIDADVLDRRAFVGPGENVLLRLPSGTITTKVDVVTTQQQELSGRAVFWDGQPITLDEAQVIAYPYAVALQRMYPNETVADICIWQVRRGNLHVVTASEALARQRRGRCAGAIVRPARRSQYEPRRREHPSVCRDV
jgi:hypothetical protein